MKKSAKLHAKARIIPGVKIAPYVIDGSDHLDLESGESQI
jgi:hypothetical protein